MPRHSQYFRAGVAELETYVKNAWNDPLELSTILVELGYRSVPRSLELRERALQRLGDLTKSLEIEPVALQTTQYEEEKLMPNDGTEDSADSPTSALATTADRSLRLTETSVIDLSGLSESEVAALRTEYARGMIDVKKKAEELQVDVGALNAALASFNDQTAKATQAGASATITHTSTSSLGRTEVVIGNTEKAASGKITRSAAGLEDNRIWVIGIVVAGVVIAAALLSRG